MFQTNETSGLYFFLSIPISGFILSDRFAWTGPVRFSFTDRRNSLRSDTTGRAFGKPNRTLVPAPMVDNSDHRRRIGNEINLRLQV